MKIGGEFLRVQNNGDWRIQEKGIMVFGSVPADISARIPQDAAMDPSRWNLAGLDPIVTRFDQNFHVGGEWTLDIPRPTWALVRDNCAICDQRRSTTSSAGRRPRATTPPT